MDQALYLMFRVNLKNLVKNKLGIAREWHIQPSEIDRMLFYEYEEIIDEINTYNKEEEKRHADEQKQYEQAQKQYKQPNLSNMTKGISQNLPKISIPRFN